MSDNVLNELERLIRTDPARRGLVAADTVYGPLLPGELQSAARELAEQAHSVGIVTGFYIPAATPPAAETDGPLGAVLIAQVLVKLGIDVVLLTDAACESALLTALRFPPGNDIPVITCQISSSGKSTQSNLSSHLCRFSHLISIERVGPNHTFESIRTQFPDAPEVWQRFESLVPSEERNRCYNMRGVCIDEFTAPLHQLFEAAREGRPRLRTIGIGDGGNEVGMGSIPWTELVRRLPEPQGGRIACRIPCDWTILAGVSNWGAYALAAAVAFLRGRVEILEPWTTSQHWEWLQDLVRHGPAVDGVTRLTQPTVDGLPFATYIQPWDAMRQLLGLPR